MNCEEFELLGLDVNRSGATAEERAAAIDHLRHCPRCAGLVESWQEARTDLFLFADATREAETPARVEMRLRQEFRARHRPFFVSRRAAVAAAWAMAAAVLIAVGAYWNVWRGKQPAKAPPVSPVAKVNPAGPEPEQLVLADGNAGSFTPLPGSLPLDMEDAAVMQVRMQRGALGALGFPVDQERASDWISVDLLVGEDGIPQAVRLHQDQMQTSATR
jgi:hypothetical protein